jgi:hypothetical protein
MQCEAGHEFANAKSGHDGFNAVEFAADFGRGKGFGVPCFMLWGTACEPDEDHRFGGTESGGLIGSLSARRRLKIARLQELGQ